MRGAAAVRIEKNVDRGASALLAAAAAYASYRWFAATAHQPMLGVETGAIAAFSYLISLRMLNLVRPESKRPPVPIFDLRKVEPFEMPELLLTERYERPRAAEPLVLDDILAELGPDSRVVRLFDPGAMPTPGQLNARIERHLGGDAPPATPQDASQALHEALAELRRSMR